MNSRDTAATRLPKLLVTLMTSAAAFARAQSSPGTGPQDGLQAPVTLLLATLRSWAEAAIAGLPNLVVALLVVVVFWLLARGTRSLARSVLRQATDNAQVLRLFSTGAYLAVLAAGVFVALGTLQLTGVVTSLLAGVGILGLALGFAFQDLAANFMAGVLMAVRRPFEIDDIVATNDHLGVVEGVTLRSTALHTFQGQRVLVPNRQVFGNPIVNYSAYGRRRVDLACGVAYGDDLEQAKRLAVEAVEGLAARDQERPVELFYTDFGDSSINFEVRFWIAFSKQPDLLAARSDAIMALKRCFDENGVTIPFPIRTLDFGVVGGVPLAEALPETLLADGP